MTEPKDTSMLDIINWLRQVEDLATRTYLKAAAKFHDDVNLRLFLEQLAEDESWHYHVMGSAAEYADASRLGSAAISIDKETKANIETLLNDVNNILEQQPPSRQELLEAIAKLELSEWNDIFVYAVNFLKETNSNFKYPAAKLQTHIRKIEHFLEHIAGQPQTARHMKEITPVWTENILIVDDEETLLNLFGSLLNGKGNIHTANNGQNALKVVDEKYCKLILSDIDMPEMNGIEFYKCAAEKYPGINKRFLFVTGRMTDDKQEFFETNNLKCMLKPVDIRTLKKAASEIIAAH